VIRAENGGSLKRVGGTTGLEFSAAPRPPQTAFSRDGEYGASIAWDGAAPEVLSLLHLVEPIYVQRVEIDTPADWVDLVASGTQAVSLVRCPQGNCLASYDPTSGNLAATYPAPVQTPFGLAISPDGTRVAVGDLRFAGPEGSGSGSALLYLLDHGAGTPIGIVGEALFSDLAFAPGGSRLAAAGPDGVTIWDLSTGTALFLSQPDVSPSFLAFSPDEAYLATDGAEGEAFIWSLASGELEEILGGFPGNVSGLSWSSDGSVIAVGTTRGEARLVSPFDGSNVGSVPTSSGSILDLAFVHGGRVLATVTSEGTGVGAIGLWGVKP
jgi:WD40 repeat protein